MYGEPDSSHYLPRSASCFAAVYPLDGLLSLFAASRSAVPHSPAPSYARGLAKSTSSTAISTWSLLMRDLLQSARLHSHHSTGEDDVKPFGAVFSVRILEKGCAGLLQRVVEPGVLSARIGVSQQHLPRLSRLRRAHDALLLEHVDEPCRPRIADVQPPL